MDYRKIATELADLLGKTAVECHNKDIAIDFIERELKNTMNQVKKLTMSSVSGWLTVEECAKVYGQKLNCKWLTLDGNDWLEKEITVDHGFLKEMEQGNIKEVYH